MPQNRWSVLFGERISSNTASKTFGDEAIVSLKNDPLTRDIPVIVLTAILYGPLLDRAIALRGRPRYSTSPSVLHGLNQAVADQKSNHDDPKNRLI